MDTLPFFRRTIEAAGLEDVVVGVVGQSPAVASAWATPLALLFIDGGHGEEPAWADYRGWTPHVAVGGLLAIHDVFPDPADGGRPPYELWCRALESGAFERGRRVRQSSRPTSGRGRGLRPGRRGGLRPGTGRRWGRCPSRTWSASTTAADV